MLSKFDYRLKRLLPLSLLLFVFATVAASADVIPTSEWLSLYSYNVTINGDPAYVGSLIDAYDEEGTHCGSDTVGSAGVYGLMPVYHDDLLTAVDEGINAVGEVITLYINGNLATPQGPDSPEWTFALDGLDVGLASNQSFDPDVHAPGDAYETPGQYHTYFFWVINDGDGIDRFALEVSSAGGWVVELMVPSTTVHVAVGDSVEVEARTLVPGTALPGDTDVMTLTATSLDGITSDDGSVLTEAEASSVGDYDPFVPGVFNLHQNYPNPFNPTTHIEFSLERAGNVKLEVYNVLGQKISTLIDEYFDAGTHGAEWDGTSDGGLEVSSGIYFYRLTSDEVSRTRKMVLMK
jgi:hypothetical protein